MYKLQEQEKINILFEKENNGINKFADEYFE